MELNADFSQHVVVHSDQLEWNASPIPTVDRRKLDRIGDEVASLRSASQQRTEHGKKQQPVKASTKILPTIRLSGFRVIRQNSSK